MGLREYASLGRGYIDDLRAKTQVTECLNVLRGITPAPDGADPRVLGSGPTTKSLPRSVRAEWVRCIVRSGAMWP
jgi:hypothetical protein